MIHGFLSILAADLIVKKWMGYGTIKQFPIPTAYLSSTEIAPRYSEQPKHCIVPRSLEVITAAPSSDYLIITCTAEENKTNKKVPLVLPLSFYCGSNEMMSKTSLCLVGLFGLFFFLPSCQFLFKMLFSFPGVAPSSVCLCH